MEQAFAPWYDVGGLWRQAGIFERLRTTLLPLITPALCLIDGWLAAIFAALVLLVCLLVIPFRLALQYFRRGKPTRLVAWRLPLAIVAAAATVTVFNASSDYATEATRDLVAGLVEETVAWPCEGEDDRDGCVIRKGYPQFEFPVHLSRDGKGRACEYRAHVYFGPDTSLDIVGSRARGLEIVSVADERMTPLDPATLRPIRDGEKDERS